MRFRRASTGVGDGTDAKLIGIMDIEQDGGVQVSDGSTFSPAPMVDVAIFADVGGWRSLDVDFYSFIINTIRRRASLGRH